jgi:ABC-2 type transport system permease protein
MSAVLTQTWWTTHRRLAALARQPGVLVITLVQPVVWLFLFGELFRRIVELPGFGTASYLDYLVPGGRHHERGLLEHVGRHGHDR